MVAPLHILIWTLQNMCEGLNGLGQSEGGNTRMSEIQLLGCRIGISGGKNLVINIEIVVTSNYYESVTNSWKIFFAICYRYGGARV